MAKAASTQVPTQQIDHLTSGSMASHPFTNQRRYEADHGHTAVETFHSGQGVRVPRPTGGQPLAKTLKRFVLKGIARHR